MVYGDRARGLAKDACSGLEPICSAQTLNY